MSRSIRLRPWQRDALRRFEASAGADFLAVATPGAGKTTFALTAAAGVLAGADRPRRLVVVAPTAHLKLQWAQAAAGLGIHLDPRWSASDGPPAPDMHGVVTTYQQVATSAGTLAVSARDSMVVLDEVHHAGDDRAWGAALHTAFAASPRRLSLSGTPFRSDTRAIPFVRYESDEARPDYEYGYGDALGDRAVVRPVHFPRTNGHMEWTAPDGSAQSAGFDDPLDRARANQRLRTALSVEGDWLPAVLRAAHDRLVSLRSGGHHDAGGLVIATDLAHARAVSDAMARGLGVRPELATSDDDGASARIARFAASDAPWMVAVRMVSEGVDIPRLRVGVYATTTTTELFFRQAVGRFVRWTRGLGAQPSYLYIPDDPRLRARAFQIAEVRRHSLRSHDRPADDTPLRDADAPTGDGDGREQLSLFAAISAVATDISTHAVDAPAPAGGADQGEADGDPGLVVALPALPLPGTGGRPDGPAKGVVAGSEPTRAERKLHLREANADLARRLARRTGWGHSQVNSELNRLAGIARVQTATLEELERRLRLGERWYGRT